MTQKKFNHIIKYIVEKCVNLKNRYVKESNLDIDYVCIFSHTQKEYTKLLHYATLAGKKVAETKTGPVFRFYISPKTVAGKPKVLKIRKPDENRRERGDVDFTTDYLTFKDTYLDNKKFTLITRKNFEMIELHDENYDVLVYFSSIPPSKLLNVT